MISDSWVGKRAPEFELIDTNENAHRLDDYSGDWLLLILHRHLG